MKQTNNLLFSIAKGIDMALNRLLAVLLAVMTSIIFLQVFCRYLLNYSFSWSEEVSRYLFLWLIFAGLPTLTYRANMTSFDMIQKRLKGWANSLAAVLIAIGNLFFLILLVWGSVPLVRRQFAQMATSVPIPIGLVYAMMPLSGVLSIIVVIERLVATFAENKKAA